MDYETRIAEVRKENRKFLKELGILREIPNTNLPPAVKRRRVEKTKQHPRPETLEATRRSERLRKIDPVSYKDLEALPLDENDNPYCRTLIPIALNVKWKKRTNAENKFGAISGIPVGTWFATRMEASHAGIHRPPVAGIHGKSDLGCYSIALSGGYEDDEDLGDSFVFTGEGGRDLRGTKAKPKNLRTAAQSKDQVLANGNLALTKSIENKLPVRVIRGYKLKSEYAPEEGYRYDGLYNVTKYYETTGLAGFKVYKFHFERIKNQDPAPWSENFLKPQLNEELAIQDGK